MKILILSDIHCLSAALKNSNAYSGTTGGSFYIEHRDSDQNLILGVADTIRQHAGKINALLCVGDIAHQSQALPLMVAWNDINQLAQELSIPHVLAVTGNHDVNSRISNIDDAIERIDFLRTMRPRYPISDEPSASRYFSDGVTFADIENTRIILVDTTKTHGMGGTPEAAKAIFAKGEITAAMKQNILSYAKSAKSDHVVIAMHHHPKRIDEVQDKDYDEIPLGANLLQELSTTGKTCIVIHGHKHFVNFGHLTPDARSPFIFSAASFAAYPYPEQSLHFANQFHIVDIDTNVINFPTGKILSWSKNGTKWVKSEKPEMPHEVRFGAPIDYSLLAEKVDKLNFESSIFFEAAAKQVPGLNDLSPSCKEPFQETLYERDLSLVFARGMYQKFCRM
tara:strand:- start:6306 stop:7490 length:1185 start_codon:yes stop_codon:yes gene_type:complete